MSNHWKRKGLPLPVLSCGNCSTWTISHYSHIGQTVGVHQRGIDTGSWAPHCGRSGKCLLQDGRSQLRHVHQWGVNTLQKLNWTKSIRTAQNRRKRVIDQKPKTEGCLKCRPNTEIDPKDYRLGAKIQPLGTQAPYTHTRGTASDSEWWLLL